MNTSSDSELLLNMLAVELTKRARDLIIDGAPHLNVEHVFDAISSVHGLVKGAYACVSVLAGYGLLALLGVYGWLGLLPLDAPGFAGTTLGISLVLITAGLLSSTFHLGHP